MSASRPFIDSFGFSWQACEVGPGGGPGESPGTASDATAGRLYFFCRGTTRVLGAYPSDWYRATWDELEELCARAAVLGADVGAVQWRTEPGPVAASSRGVAG